MVRLAALTTQGASGTATPALITGSVAKRIRLHAGGGHDRVGAESQQQADRQAVGGKISVADLGRDSMPEGASRRPNDDP